MASPFSSNNPGIGGLNELTVFEEGIVASIASLGTNGQVLATNAAEDGVEWVNPASGGNTNLTQFTDQTAWRIFYSNADGDVTELALGASGEFLKSNGATSAPEWSTPTGSGDVTAASAFGTDNQLIKSDGTGKGVQATGITVDDSNNVSGLGTLNTHTVPGGTGTLALTSQLHNAVTVTDSSEIDFTLTGQEITASIIAGSIDESKLDTSVNASLDLADSAVQDADIADMVEGPASATDNAIVRYDGTTGKLIQNSAVTVDDSGNITVGDNTTDVIIELAGQNNSATGARLRFSESMSEKNGISLVYDSSDNRLRFYDDLTGSSRVYISRDNGNIYTPGNILLDGTVDGRDLATDGTKLDGIEAGAEVNEVTLAGTETLTNKTIDADSNTLTNVEVDNFKASAIVTEAEGIGNNDNDTSVPTSAAVIDYVENSGGGGGADVQEFATSGTWTKPEGAVKVFVQMWGAGGSGGRAGSNDGGGGGGGGSYVEAWFDVDDLGATESVTVGAGGAAATSDEASGSVGGVSSFGSFITAYGGGGGAGNTAVGGGGGGGGGTTSNGGSGSNTTGGTGGGLLGGAGGTTGVNGAASTFGGGGGGGEAAFSGGVVGHGGSSICGGGGGGGGRTSTQAANGGNSVYGGGGGGGGLPSGTIGSGGTSKTGGAGGAGANGSSVATSGSVPGGGGGGSCTGNSGAGGDGKVVVTTFL